MSKELARAGNNEAVLFTQSQIDTMKNTLMPQGTSNNELALFLEYCKRTGLDPFARQIYATKIQGKLSIQSSIDGFRLIAERSGKYRGQTIPLYMDAKGGWSEVWVGTGFPVACKVGVLRSDFAEPLYGIAKWSSYAQQTSAGVGYMWKKMPEVMLAKVAEALALRKAFPNDLSGLYTSDEMDQATTPTTSEPVKPKVINNDFKTDYMSDEDFQKNVNLVDKVNDIKVLETRYGSIDRLPRLTDEQKASLKEAHLKKIMELDPQYSDPNNIINKFGEDSQEVTEVEKVVNYDAGEVENPPLN